MLNQLFRRHRHRGRAGRAPSGWAADGSRHEGRADRAQAVRRNLRQYRLHADQDAGRQRLCGSPCPAERRVRISIDSPVRIDMKRVKARADTVSANARTNIEKWLRGMDGLTVIRGTCALRRAGCRPGGREPATAPRIFINVGGRASVPDMPGVGTVDHLTNGSILGLDTVPSHLIVVGGSYVGLEFAQMYRRFGAEVTVIEKGPRLIAREDEDVSEAVREILADEGIVVRTDAECIALEAACGRCGCRHRLHLRRARGGRLAGSAGGRAPAQHGRSRARPGGRQGRRPRLYRRGRRRLRRMFPAYGRWAIAMAAAHSPIRPTTITRLSPRTSSTARRGGSATGFPPTRSISTRRSGVSGCPRAEARKTGRPLLVSKRPMTRVGRAIEKGETKGS